jgi:hypothetical protein
MTAVVIVTIATIEMIAVVVVVVATVAATDMTDIAEGMTVLLTAVTDHAPLPLAAIKMTAALPGPHLRRGNMMIKDLQGTMTGEEAMMTDEDLTLIMIVVGMKTAPVATIEDVMTRTIDMMEGPPDTLLLMETRHSVGKRLVEVVIGHIWRWLRGPRTAAWSFSF